MVVQQQVLVLGLARGEQQVVVLWLVVVDYQVGVLGRVVVEYWAHVVQRCASVDAGGGWGLAMVQVGVDGLGCWLSALRRGGVCVSAELTGACPPGAPLRAAGAFAVALEAPPGRARLSV